MVQLVFRIILSIGVSFIVVDAVWTWALRVFEETLTSSASISPWVVGTFLLFVFAGAFFLGILLINGILKLIKKRFLRTKYVGLSAIECVLISIYVILWGITAAFSLIIGEFLWLVQEGQFIVTFLRAYLFGVGIFIIGNSVHQIWVLMRDKEWRG